MAGNDGGEADGETENEWSISKSWDSFFSNFSQKENEEKPPSKLAREYVDSVLKENEVVVFSYSDGVQNKSINKLFDNAQVNYLQVDT